MKLSNMLSPTPQSMNSGGTRSHFPLPENFIVPEVPEVFIQIPHGLPVTRKRKMLPLLPDADESGYSMESALKKKKGDPRKIRYEGLYVCLTNMKQYVKGADDFENAFLPVRFARRCGGIWTEVSTYQKKLPKVFRVPSAALYYLPKKYDESDIEPESIVLASWQEIWWEAQVMDVKEGKVSIEWVGEYRDYGDGVIEEFSQEDIIPSCSLVMWDGEEWEE